VPEAPPRAGSSWLGQGRVPKETICEILLPHVAKVPNELLRSRALLHYSRAGVRIVRHDKGLS
jgi:hypothetical protein